MSIFHRHKWRAALAHMGEFALLGGDCTLVLYRCGECGASETKTINGHWTVEELTGEP